MDPQLYEKEVNSQLNDQLVHKKVTYGPTWSIRKQLECILKPAPKEGVITRDLFEFVLPTHTRIPVVYTLPKIHKDSQSPPGRPIVSERDSIFVPVAQLLDKILFPLVRDTKSYLRDTNDFLCKLKDVSLCQGNELLVTWGVVSLTHPLRIQLGLVRL